ncbi:MAG: hypothetical protein EPN47_00755 [Acidobacteria bacterium]|nr:MAG: hypothetical protein EPN47_00755 [Acidobacteriota bacterium]
MYKRLLAVAFAACAVVLSPVLLPAQAAAQDQGHYTYVSFWAVPRGDWAAFEQQQKSREATMHNLVADGTIVAWGDLATRVHQEGGYTHSDFFTATSRANLLKALEIVWAGATNAAFVATTRHSDVFHHTIAHGGKTVSEATGYLRVTHWQARPGAERALQAYVMKNIKPMLDNNVADGTILMYNFDEEDIHTNPPGAFDLAVAFPDGAAIDKFFAEVTAAEKADPSVGQVLENLTVAKAHHDSLNRVMAFEHK